MWISLSYNSVDVSDCGEWVCARALVFNVKFRHPIFSVDLRRTIIFEMIAKYISYWSINEMWSQNVYLFGIEQRIRHIFFNHMKFQGDAVYIAFFIISVQ